MKAVNEVKPINVLSRFIASWIRDRWQETAPFDSFETLRTLSSKKTSHAGS